MSGIIKSESVSRETITLIDEVSSTVTYIGKAKLGTAGSDAFWQIRKIQKVGTVTSIQYADGDRQFDNVWNSRASLTYQN